MRVSGEVKEGGGLSCEGVPGKVKEGEGGYYVRVCQVR